MSIVHCRNFSFDIIDVGGLKCFTFTFYLTLLMSVVLKLSDIWSVSLKMIGLWPPPHNKTVSGKRLEKLRHRFLRWTNGRFEFSSGLKPGSQSHLVWSEVEVSVFYSLPVFQFIPNFFQIYFQFASNSPCFQFLSHVAAISSEMNSCKKNLFLSTLKSMWKNCGRGSCPLG